MRFFNDIPWITLMTALPVLGAVLIATQGRRETAAAKRYALGFSVVAAALAGVLLWKFNPDSNRLQFEERHTWIELLGVEYYVGLDGLGLVMVLLTALLVPMAILASWRVQERPVSYFSLLLALQGGLFGTFTALNFFHWFLFWELSLVPAFFLIKLWGGPARSAAATQFFVFTMVGSVTMLLGFLALFLATSTFDFVELAGWAASGRLAGAVGSNITWAGMSPESLLTWIFLAVLLGFAVKVPLWPFHSWLPATYAEAPSGVTMILTGAMSKMGVYGFLRILLPIFPEQTQALLTPLLWLAVGTIVFSAFAAFAQTDLKRVLAYSSINHLGYCLLGLFAVAQVTGTEPRWAEERAAALNGVILQMFNHGLTAAALFCFVGFLEQRAGGRRDIDGFGGLRKVAPAFCGLMGISVFASLGLPGLNGFVGEFLIFKGAFALTPWAAVLSAAGLLATAVFLLTMMQRVFHGPLNERWAGFPDLTWKELALLLPAVGLMFVLGVHPQLLIGLFNETVVAMVADLKF
jgi:NADH-quinone oxidoreductase subunit M